MARQFNSYSLVEGSEPDPLAEFQFGYDPALLGQPVQITFPEGAWTLSVEQCVELGTLLLAMADQQQTERVAELLAGFGLLPPPFLFPGTVPLEVAAQIVAAFTKGFPQVRRAFRNRDLRHEMVAAIATQVERVLR